MAAIVQWLEHGFVVPVMRVRFPLAAQLKTFLMLGAFLINTKKELKYPQ